MNNASESQNEKLSPTIQITNQIPKNQSLQIQNIDPNHPIQLKVDPITDYFALSVTITVSILTAIISAYVTIKIVTKSNEKLIESQELLQNNALKHNKEKELSVLTSKNRQDWINTLRTDISEIISKSSVHDKFHRTLILSGFCFLKIAKISLNSSFFPKPIKC